MMQKIDKTDTLETVLTKGRLEVDYYQREYRWGRKNIEQMIMDLSDTFRSFYDQSSEHTSPKEVQNYGYYYMGSIICANGDPRQIIDGQQRLTSLTLLLIYLRNLQRKTSGVPGLPVAFDNLIFKDDYGTMSFNLDIPERNDCMQALWEQNLSYSSENESNRNLLERYADIEELFPEDLRAEALPYFIYWLKSKVLLLEIDTPSEDEAHTIFLTMNDRGLSLNSAEMLKAYIIQQTDECDRAGVNRTWQTNIGKIKNAFGSNSSGSVKAEDVDFISTWLRAKYAKTMRDTKKGAEDRDFELLGEKFHSWVRQNAKTQMGLTQARQFRDFATVEMTLMTDVYLRMKQYSDHLTPGFEAVFYNAHRDISYQYYLIMTAICVGDTKDAIDQKIKMISAFIDIFASTRIFNYKKVNWNSNKTVLFRIITQIRNRDVKTIGIKLVSALNRMSEKLDAITSFELNQYTGRYMLHLLARITDYVNMRMGLASMFAAYIDRTPKSSYDIEHILPDAYEDYKDDFNDEEDFQNNRCKIGNLILLTCDHNRSYQDMAYGEKVEHYMFDNILAQSLNPNAYEHNPKFLALKDEFGFKPYTQFTKGAIRERMALYVALAKQIWNPAIIRQLAGGWDDETEITIESNNGLRYTVEYGDGRSWEDARRWGFVSAGSSGWNKLKNIHTGDFVFCHIASVGFVGVGICCNTAVPADEFLIDHDGTQRPILTCIWTNEAAKRNIDPTSEWFLGVKWLRTVPTEDGFWEKGMVSIPMVAYTLDDRTTHDKVLEHFNIKLSTHTNPSVE